MVEEPDGAVLLPLHGRDTVEAEVRPLLEYTDESAGGLMTPAFVALRSDETAQQSIERLRRANQELQALDQVKADLVVLATAMEPADRGAIAGKLRIAADAHGFFKEAHPKLRPVETLSAGIFLAGTAQAPKDIPDTVAQASAAAAKGLELLSKDSLERDPLTAQVDEALCAGCFECLEVCPYHAIERRQILDSEGALVREVAWPNPAMCEGCGLCAVTCPVYRNRSSLRVHTTSATCSPSSARSTRTSFDPGS